MKRSFGTMKKFISLMICTVMVLSAVSPAFAGPEGSESEETASASEIVEINDTRAFVSFAAGAKLQSFSTGKTFVLKADIDLSDFDGVSVPYLDGCFEGGGHSITGLKIEGDISDCGLFRYVGKNGFVRDLTVEAEIISGDDQKRVGIIAGTNEGEIVRCTSKGSVNAQSHVGGITGCNEESGVIRTCVNEAAIDGKYQTGGIAGMNMGSITGCTNKGGVNNNPRIKKNQGLGDSDAVNISLPNAVTGFAADERANETGGIAGRSIGNIVYCTNEAPVGHSDLGSDTGGIAGRVSGGIMGCENLALISGRQNTGGIAGSLDPYRVVSMDRDYYDELVKEFDSLDEAMQNLSDSGRRLGDDITDNFDDISDRVKTLRDSVRGYFDGYDADIRTARDRIHNEINDISDIIDDMDYDFRLKKLKKHVNVLRDDVESINSLMERLYQMAELADAQDAPVIFNTIQKYATLVQKLEAFIARLESIIELIKSGAVTSPALTPEPVDGESLEEDGKKDRRHDEEEDSEEVLDEYEEEAAAAEEVAETEETPGSVEEGSNEDKDVDSDGDKDKEKDKGGDGKDNESSDEDVRPVANDNTGSVSSDMAQKYQDYLKIKETVQKMHDCYLDATDQLDGIASCLSKWPDLAMDIRDDLKDINEDGKDIHKYTDVLLDSIFGRTDAMRVDVRGQGDELSDSVDDMSDTLSADWNRVADAIDVLRERFDTVRTTVHEGHDELRNMVEDRTVYEDISETADTSLADGKILYCKNSGEITAKSRAGGIVGNIDIDDVKDNAVDIFERFRYPDDDEDEEDDEEDEEEKDSIVRHVRAVVFNCSNGGDITTDNGYAGGIAGRACYGVISGCESYCDVNAGDGKWAGGIAGLSRLSVYSSYVFGGVAGKAFVGGIAGKGENIGGTYSCVYVDSDVSALHTTGAVAGKAGGNVADNNFVDNGYGAVDGITKVGEARSYTYRDMIKTFNLPEQFKRFKIRFVDGDEVVWSGDFSYDDLLGEDKYPELLSEPGEYAYWEKKDVSPVKRNVTVHSVRRVSVPSIASLHGSDTTKSMMVLAGDFYPDSVLQVTELTGADLEKINEAKQKLTSGKRYVVTKAYKYGISQEEPLPESLEVRALTGLVPVNMAFVLDENLQPVTDTINTTMVKSYAAFNSAIPAEGYVVLMVHVSNTTMLVIIIVLLDALIIFLLVGIFIRRKRKARMNLKKAENAGEETGSEDTAAKENAAEENASEESVGEGSAAEEAGAGETEPGEPENTGDPGDDKETVEA